MKAEERASDLFRKTILAELARRKITRYEFADNIGIARGHCYRILSGETDPSVTLANRMLMELGFEIDVVKTNARVFPKKRSKKRVITSE